MDEQKVPRQHAVMDVTPSRRLLLQGMGALTALPLLPRLARAQAGSLRRVIPSTGEAIPAIGLGTWITFNVGDDRVARDECAAVLRAFFAAGGGMVDSSPMYGSSQAVVGDALQKLGQPAGLFAADKVWISSSAAGPKQIEESRRHWSVPRFDLLQVHNLVSWPEHLKTLQAMKAAGQLRYVGITTSEGRRHREFEDVMRHETLDFIQVTYNPVDRAVEERILPLAAERGIAVIVNRPFRQGALTRRLAGQPLPGWAREIGAVSWAQALLKFTLAHPSVTVIIPATSRVAHVQENIAAAGGALPDATLRARIAREVALLA